MLSSPLASKATLGLLLSSFPYIAAQSVPGAQLLEGGGAPGAAPYVLVDEYSPSLFLSKFNYYDSYDPTYGHVQYVNESVAVQNGYTYYSQESDSVIIKPDTVGLWPNGGKGRPSIRITSDNTYNHGLFIMDMKHMPAGCGTWPAYWLLGPNWPYTGEVDIIEGVHTSEINTISLHSTADCTIAGGDQLGEFETSVCDSNANGNSGCGSQLTNMTALPNNYGSSFNDNEGGVYATEWTSEYIKTWWFPRESIPDSILLGEPDISTFGLPAMNGQGNCDIDSHFQNMSVIINIDFCGAWAGNVYYNSFPNCPQSATAATDPIGSCVDFVGNNPDQLGEAYFEIYSLKVYQMPSDVAPTSSYTTSLSSVAPMASTNTVPLGMGGTTSTISSAPVFTGSIAGPAATNPATVCPQYDQSIIQNSNGQQDLIYCGYDWSGGNLDTQGGVASFDACMVLCDKFVGCEAVTFTGGNGGGACYLKPVGVTLVEASGSNAAKRVDGVATGSSMAPVYSTTPASTTTPAPGGVATIAASAAACPANNMAHVIDNCGVEYVLGCGNDTSSGSYAAVQVASLEACFELCSSGAQGACSAFAYISDSKYCYFKGGTLEHFANPQAGIIGAIQVAYLNTPYGPTNSVSRACVASTVAFASSTRIAAASSTVLSSSPAPTSTARTSSASSSAQAVASSSVLPSSSALTSSSAPVVSIPDIASSILSAASSAGQDSVSSLVPGSSMMAPSIATDSPGVYSSSVASPATSSQAVLHVSSTMTPEPATPETLVSIIGGITVTYCPDCVAPTASSTTSAAVSSSTAVPACPTQTAAICGFADPIQTPTTCSSPGEATYVVMCGIVYTGTEIPDDQINRLKNATRLASRSGVMKRFDSPDFGGCQSACDNTDGCIALNYLGTECTLLSTVDGTSLQPGAVSAAQVDDAPMGDDEPTCPESNGMVYTDSNAVSYTVSCAYRYDGNNLNVVSADTFSECLPWCDAASACVGVQYDTESGICYLKSFFAQPGFDTIGSFIVGMKAVVAPSSSTTSSAFSSASSSAVSSVSSVDASSSAAIPSSAAGPTITTTTGITTTAATVTVEPAITVTTSGAPSGVVTATSVIISTLPAGATITTISSGSSTGSFFVFTTTSASVTGGDSTPTGACIEEICFNCGLIPIVTTNCGGPSTTFEPPPDAPTPTAIPSTMLITSNGVTYTSVGYVKPTSSASVTAVGACPTQTVSLCSSSSKELSCASLSGLIYELACDVIVLGIEILDALVDLLDKRVVLPDLGSCLSACDSTASCVAINYVNMQCTLFSSVSGTSLQAGAVSAVQVGASGGGVGPTTSTITSYNGFCPSLTASGTGTTTIYNTYTITSCAAQPICPNPGYVIIGGSATVSGGIVVTTTNGSGAPITYTQIQTSDIPITTTNSNGATVVYTQTAVPIYTGGGGSGGGGVGTGPGTGPGTGFNTITETTTNSNGVTYFITQTPSPSGSGPGNGPAVITTTDSRGSTVLYTVTTTLISTASNTNPGTGPGTGAGTGLGTEVATPTTGGPTTTVTTTALPTCPYANGQVYVDSSGFSYIIICDTAFSGILLNTVTIEAVGAPAYARARRQIEDEASTQPRLSDCIAACDAYNLLNQYTTQCEGVSLDSNVATDNCALIGGEITVTTKLGVYSGRVLRAVGGPGGTTIITGGGPTQTVAQSSYGPPSTNTVTTTTISISVSTAVVTTGGTGGSGGVVTSLVPSTVYGVSTVFSTIVSNGVTVIQTYGVSTAISVSYVPATASTVTTTLYSNRVTTVLSNGVTTVIIPSTIQGPTVTTNGGTITQAGPTVTATGAGGSGGGTVTVTNGSGDGGTATVSRTTTTTVISYVLPSSTSRSSTSSNVCRTTATNYLRGSLPGKRSFLDYDRKLAGDELLPRPGAVAAL